ncbi:MAG: polyprenyl synthetase family protein [Rhizobiaceae bacterium]|nr:polyprenyl synthetase family protein [Rhizobiaceae bacterium]
MNAEEFKARLKAHGLLVDRELDNLLGSDGVPERLKCAMRYGALDGGKRLRPFLLMEAAAIFGVANSAAIRAAVALECVHCYSLVHDDLPAMDDDETRRGKPTVHKAFDEATAILAGDGLLTFAFEILADEATHEDGSVRSKLILELARAAGPAGMVGGQDLDLNAEHMNWGEAEINNMQAMKTGALIRFACQAGAILGKASSDEEQALVSFGMTIGQAFQLADDILDVTASAETMGKNTAKDGERGKGTLVALFGVDRAKDMAAELVEEAHGFLAPFGDKADVLKSAASFIVERDH